MKPIIQSASSKKSIVIWQGCNEDQNFPEPAILIEEWSETISLTQAGSLLNLNYESIPELAKYLMKAYRKYEEAKTETK